MRVSLLACLAFIFSSCNSSGKKNPNQSMDDTARMNDPNHIVNISTVNMAVGDIPSSIKIKGQVQEALKWNDNLGENIFITSYMAPYDDKDEQYGEDGQTAELHAYHYAKKEGNYREVWTLNEVEKACPFDITCEFIPGSTTVTDMDKDGIAETKVQYAMACRSDVSPAAMKLLMNENGTKYMLKGNRWLAYSPEIKFNVTDSNVNLAILPKLKDETEEMLRSFGRYENEKDFAGAPSPFLFYARTEWLKHVKEKIGE